MDSILPTIRLDALSDPWWRQALPGAMQACVAFTFVAARLAGLVILGPMFASTGLGLKMRALLVAAIALVLTPALLAVDRETAFHRLDRNGDGLLHISEAPPSLGTPLRRMLSESGKEEHLGVSPAAFQWPLPMPATLVEYALSMMFELAIGLGLGLGMTTILSSLLMAGSLIDQQLGLSMSELFHPESGASIGVSGQMLHQLGLVVFLIAGGHVLLISALIDTFQALPVGYACLHPPVFEALCALVHQSFALALEVAAPVLAVMALVGLATGILGRALPQLNAMMMGLSLRAFVGLLVLGLSLGPIGESIRRSVPETMQQLRNGLIGTP